MPASAHTENECYDDGVEQNLLGLTVLKTGQ